MDQAGGMDGFQGTGQFPDEGCGSQRWNRSRLLTVDFAMG